MLGLAGGVQAQLLYTTNSNAIPITQLRTAW